MTDEPQPRRPERPVPDLAALGVPMTTRQIVGGLALLTALAVILRRLLSRRGG